MSPNGYKSFWSYLAAQVGIVTALALFAMLLFGCATTKHDSYLRYSDYEVVVLTDSSGVVNYVFVRSDKKPIPTEWKVVTGVSAEGVQSVRFVAK